MFSILILIFKVYAPADAADIAAIITTISQINQSINERMSRSKEKIETGLAMNKLLL